MNKLTNETVMAIVEDLKTMTQVAVAGKHGVSTITVSNIARGVSHSDITGIKGKEKTKRTTGSAKPKGVSVEKRVHTIVSEAQHIVASYEKQIVSHDKDIASEEKKIADMMHAIEIANVKISGHRSAQETIRQQMASWEQVKASLSNSAK